MFVFWTSPSHGSFQARLHNAQLTINVHGVVPLLEPAVALLASAAAPAAAAPAAAAAGTTSTAPAAAAPATPPATAAAAIILPRWQLERHRVVHTQHTPGRLLHVPRHLPRLGDVLRGDILQLRHPGLDVAPQVEIESKVRKRFVTL